MNKISAVYQIINSVTGDRYVGSSKDVKRRWTSHKWPSRWKKCPNNPLYLDMQKYGVDKFRFQILAPVMPEYLKQVEQEFIEMLHPTYNDKNAKGLDVERWKEVKRKYRQTDRGKEINKKYLKKYRRQLCSYNGETLTLGALIKRFSKADIPHPFLEAKKYLLDQDLPSSREENEK